MEGPAGSGGPIRGIDWEMPHHRKFLCFGVPRSGTTYFAHLMNSHPNAFCGMEAFPPHLFRSDFLEPKSFLKNVNNSASRDHGLRMLRKKRFIKVMGDKFPRAYHDMRNVMREMKGEPLFCIVRKSSEVFLSFDIRASDPNDDWNPGMIWIIAYLEAMHVVHCLLMHRKSNFIIVGYDYLVGPDTRLKAAVEIFSVFGLGVNSKVYRYLGLSRERTVRSIKKVRRLTEAQEQIQSLPHMRLYDDLVSGVKICTSSKLYDGLNRVSELLIRDFYSERDLFLGVLEQVCKNPHFVALWTRMRATYASMYSAPPMREIFRFLDSVVESSGAQGGSPILRDELVHPEARG